MIKRCPRQIAALDSTEAVVRGLSADERLAIWQARTAPLIEASKLWLDQARTQVSAKSPTGAALKYINRYLDGLVLFLDDGRTEMDNNTVERTIRPIALGRKNALFAGHEAGAQDWAIFASLIETCKLNGVNSPGYLADTLSRIANGHPQSRIAELLSWNHAI